MGYALTFGRKLSSTMVLLVLWFVMVSMCMVFAPVKFVADYAYKVVDKIADWMYKLENSISDIE
jgi:hypothetical protein